MFILRIFLEIVIYRIKRLAGEIMVDYVMMGKKKGKERSYVKYYLFLPWEWML